MSDKFQSFFTLMLSTINSAWDWIYSIFSQYGITLMLALTAVSLLSVKVVSPMIRSGMSMSAGSMRKSSKDKSRKGDN